MDAKTKTKQVNTLMSLYIRHYRDRYGVDPRFNRNTERWGFGYLLDDLGPKAFATLEYYFTLRRKHSTSDFLSNYHDLVDWMREDEEDEQMRQELREQTKQRVKEYEQQWQQQP